jgi:hypothetical protein
LFSIRDALRVVKNVAGVVSVASSAAAAIAAVVAAGCGPVVLCSGVAAATAGFFEGINLGSTAVSTVIDCTDGGSAFGCVAGLASTLGSLIAFPVLKRLATELGVDLATLARASLNSLFFGSNTARLLADMKAGDCNP